MDFKDCKTLVLFSGQLEGDDGHYGNIIDKILKGRKEIYHQILFLCPDYLWPEIAIMLALTGSELVSNITRISQVSEIAFFSFNGYANLTFCHQLIGNDISGISLNKLKCNVIKHGLLSLVEKRKDQVILKAPSGTVFQKPSGDKFSEFIKASELAVDFSENQFVAFTLLAHRPEREDEHAIKHIWIDSASIASYVEALVYFITKFNGDSSKQLQYHSFQSYGKDKTEGYTTCEPEVKNNIWVIISASSSNNLGVKIFGAWPGLQHDQIVTLLSFADSEGIQRPLCGSDIEQEEKPYRPGDKIVVNISKYSAAHTKAKKNGYEIPVEINGENFTAQVKDPVTVLLKQAHGPVEIKKFVEPNNQLEHFCVYKSHQQKLRPVFFDFVKFANCEDDFRQKYLDWLKKVVDWYVPRSISTVIYDTVDSASCLLYQHLTHALGRNDIKTVDIKGKLNGVDKEGAIIALLPVMTRGNSLVKLNSDLRLIGHNAQRIFITPFAVSPTRTEFSAFKNSLVFGPNGLKYQFLNFRHVFVGHQEEKYSWEHEYDVISGFNHSVFKKRKHALEQRSIGLLNAIGTSCDLNNEKLAFNPHFAFWGPNYQPCNVNPSAVYVTVCAILQNLREQPPLEAGCDSLYAQVYQHSVLDPDNFSRFNDPLLQACLWRSAYGRELDYRSQDNLARRFGDNVTRLARCRADGEHNATLDILIGIATQRIQLPENCLANLVSQLRAILTGLDAHLEVLDFIANGFEHSFESVM